MAVLLTHIIMDAFRRGSSNRFLPIIPYFRNVRAIAATAVVFQPQMRDITGTLFECGVAQNGSYNLSIREAFLSSEVERIQWKIANTYPEVKQIIK